MAKVMGIFKDKLFWIMLGVIIVASVLDYLIPQLPAADPGEAVLEATKIISAVVIGIRQMIE